MAEIILPPQLAHPGYRFIKLGSHGEALKRPIEKGWNIFDLEELRIYLEKKAAQWDADKASGKHEDLRLAGKYVPKRPMFRGRLNNYAYDETEFTDWLKRGKNYGVTGAGGLIKLESDDIPRWHELGVLDLMPEGFAVKSSSPTRQHFYFEFDEKIADAPLKDPETGEDIGHIRATGEAGGRGGMVVGPGSLHPLNVRYDVIKDLPIPKIDRETLDKIIAKFQPAGKPTTTQRVRAKKADLKDPFTDVTISQVLGTDYHDFHLEGSQMAGPNPYGSHANKNGHCLVIEPDDKSFYCFECEQGGGVSRLIAIKAGIMRCSDKGAPTGQAWWDTIRYALNEGTIDEPTAKAAGLGQKAGIEINVLEYHDFFIKDYTEDDSGNIKEKMILSLSHAAHTIADKLRLAMVKGDAKTIWRFNGQIYHDDGEPLIRDCLYRIAGDKAHTTESNELINRLHASLSLKPVVFNPNPFLFPAIDGVLDLRTGEIRAGKPEDLMTFTYNAHCHHPAADYDRFLFYLASSLPDLRDCLTAIDLITKAVIRIPFELFVFLLGGGENGKGIFEKVLISLLGMDRVSATKIEEIKKSYFATGNLLGKDAWVITEVETVKEAISTIKAISSGEMLDSDIKYGTGRTKGIPHLLPILDANKALDFKDPSWGRRRRTLKLDFPYEFGYKPDSRPKDPMLLDKLTAHESLAGILQIIKARAPSLIRSRRIYRRKSSEQQEAELDRQRFSLQHFCNDCLTTTADWLDNVGPLDKSSPPPKLRADEAYQMYKEYCRLWNVPEPAEKVPFGRYIGEKYNVESKTSSEMIDGKKKTFRYYPGIHCGKSSATAHAEIYVDYEEIPQTTTDILQVWIGEKDTSKENTTDTTDKRVFWDVIDKLQKMYIFVQSCQNPRDILYEKFLGQKSVVSVVLQKKEPDDTDNSNHGCTTDPISTVVKEPTDIEPQINQVQATTLPERQHNQNLGDDEKHPQVGIGPHPLRDAPTPSKKSREAGQ